MKLRIVVYSLAMVILTITSCTGKRTLTPSTAPGQQSQVENEPIENMDQEALKFMWEHATSISLVMNGACKSVATIAEDSLTGVLNEGDKAMAVLHKLVILDYIQLQLDNWQEEGTRLDNKPIFQFHHDILLGALSNWSGGDLSTEAFLELLDEECSTTTSLYINTCEAAEEDGMDWDTLDGILTEATENYTGYLSERFTPIDNSGSDE